jgi:hypothetical protein
MKKKKFNFDQRKFDLFTGGKPCTPGDLRNISKEDVEDDGITFRINKKGKDTIFGENL